MSLNITYVSHEPKCLLYGAIMILDLQSYAVHHQYYSKY